MIHGILYWNDQKPPMARSVTAYHSAYKRFTITQMRSGQITTWLREMTGRGLPVGVAIQELVPHSIAIPSGLFIGAYDSGVNAFVPNYLDETFLPRYALELDKLQSTLSSYPYPYEVQISIGCWGENHFGSVANRALIPDANTEQGRVFFRALIDLYLARWEPEQLRVGTDSLFMLDYAFTKGVRKAFRHSAGFNKDDTDYFMRPWQNVKARQQLDQCGIMIEPYRTETLGHFDARKMYYQIVGLPQINAIADGNTDLVRRTESDVEWIDKALRLVASRVQPEPTDSGLQVRLDMALAELSQMTEALNQMVLNYNNLDNERNQLVSANEWLKKDYAHAMDALGTATNELRQLMETYVALYKENETLEIDRSLLKARADVLASRLYTLATAVLLAESQRQSVLEQAKYTLDNEVPT